MIWITTAAIVFGLILLAATLGKHTFPGEGIAALPVRDALAICLVVLGTALFLAGTPLQETVATGALIAVALLALGTHRATRVHMKGRDYGVGYALILWLAERPFRLVVIVASAIFLCAPAYWVFGLVETDECGRPDDVRRGDGLPFWDALYFSVVTVTTLGYGDYAPNATTRPVAATEALFGYLAFGLFVSMIVFRLSNDDKLKCEFRKRLAKIKRR